MEVKIKKTKGIPDYFTVKLYINVNGCNPSFPSTFVTHWRQQQQKISVLATVKGLCGFSICCLNNCSHKKLVCFSLTFCDNCAPHPTKCVLQPKDCTWMSGIKAATKLDPVKFVVFFCFIANFDLFHCVLGEFLPSRSKGLYLSFDTFKSKQDSTENLFDKRRRICRF